MPDTQTNSVLADINDINHKLFKNSLQSELSLKLVDEVENKTLLSFYQMILELKMRI